MLCDFRPKKNDKNMMLTTVGTDAKSAGITSSRNTTTGISASSGAAGDKFSAELSVAAGSSSEESVRKNQNADLARENNDHTYNTHDNEHNEEEEDDDDDDTDLT